MGLIAVDTMRMVNVWAVWLLLMRYLSHGAYYVRLIYPARHQYCAGVRVGGLKRRPPTPRLGTVLQPASQVPSSRHSGFNGTNGNRHPGSSVLSPTSLSANPSLHSSLRLKNNVPEKVKPKNQKPKTKNQKAKTLSVFSLSLGRKSDANRMLALEEEAPGMAHADSARRWRLG